MDRTSQVFGEERYWRWVQEEFREGLPGEVVREQHERAQAFVATHTHHFATDRHDLLQAHKP